MLTVLWQSLHFERLNQQQRGTPFIGLENFVRMLWGRDEMAWSASKLWLLRAAMLTAIWPVWYAVRRGTLKRGAAVLATIALVVVAGWLLGYQPAEGTRWGDPRFWNSFNITLLLIVVTVVGAFLLGLPLALLANVDHPLKWLVRLALLLPWAMPRVFSGLAFAWLFQSDYGVINDLLGRMGINTCWRAARGVIGRAAFWLARDARRGGGLFSSSEDLLVGLTCCHSSPRREPHEAARIDGANAWQRFS